MHGYPFVLSLCVVPVFAQAPEEPGPPAPIVFFDIAGEDSAGLTGFYASVFNWQIAPDGSLTAQIKSPPLVPRADYPSASIGFSTSVTAPLPGQIRQDPAEKRIYLGVADVAAT
jgi:predicted enzyme related to lactoylglutathione lyase